MSVLYIDACEIIATIYNNNFICPNVAALALLCWMDVLY